MAPGTRADVAPLATLLDRFPRARVVVVGDFVADEYVYGETERISREAPVLIVRFERSELQPGGAGNAAQNLAALDVEVRAVGLVGRDSLGVRLLGALRAGSRCSAWTARPIRSPPRSSGASSSTWSAPPAAPPPCSPPTTARACCRRAWWRRSAASSAAASRSASTPATTWQGSPASPC